MADITIYAGDRLPLITRSITVDGVAVDLTGASAVFKVFDPATFNVLINNPATITTPASGTIVYSWSAADTTALTAGNYFAQFVATSNGKNITAPNDGYLTLLVAGPTASSFTYSGDPSLRNLDAVRFYLQDTNADDVKLSDDEIEFLLGQYGSALQAARAGAESLSAKFAGLASTAKSVGDLHITTTYNQQAAQYSALADRLSRMALRVAPPRIIVNSDSLLRTEERDKMAGGSDFHVGQTDNPNSGGLFPYGWR